MKSNFLSTLLILTLCAHLNGYGQTSLSKTDGQWQLFTDGKEYKVKGDDLDDVKERIDDIDIEFESNSGMVEAITVFGNDRNSSWSWWKRNNRKNMSMKINYTIKMPKSNSVSLNNDYGNIYLNEIDGKASVNCDSGSVVVKKLEAGFESVNIETQYASVKINVDSNAAFNFEINTQYAGFKTDLDPIEFFKKISKSTKRYYEGKYGSGSNSGTIKIKSQYGGVSINEY